MPDPSGILIGIKQLINLINKIVNAKTNYSSKAKHQVFTDPNFHKWLVKAKETTSAKTRDPCDQKGKFFQIRKILFFRFHNYAIADARRAGLKSNTNKTNDRSQNIVIVLINCQYRQAKKC